MHDLVEASDVAGDIVQTPRMGEAMLALRTLHVRDRLPPRRDASERRRVAHVVDALFTWFCAHPEELPAGPRGDDLATRVIDHVAGMTDRFALRAYRERFVPDGWAGQ